MNLDQWQQRIEYKQWEYKRDIMKKILLLYPTDLVDNTPVIHAIIEADVVGSVDETGHIVKVIKSRSNDMGFIIGNKIALSEFGSLAVMDGI